MRRIALIRLRIVILKSPCEFGIESPAPISHGVSYTILSTTNILNTRFSSYYQTLKIRGNIIFQVRSGLGIELWTFSSRV